MRLAREKLLDGGDSSADADVFSVCRGSSELRGRVNPFGDEVECGAAFHCGYRSA